VELAFKTNLRSVARCGRCGEQRSLCKFPPKSFTEVRGEVKIISLISSCDFSPNSILIISLYAQMSMNPLPYTLQQLSCWSAGARGGAAAAEEKE
jgi:hypothetical protein